MHYLIHSSICRLFLCGAILFIPHNSFSAAPPAQPSSGKTWMETMAENDAKTQNMTLSAPENGGEQYLKDTCKNPVSMQTPIKNSLRESLATKQPFDIPGTGKGVFVWAKNQQGQDAMPPEKLTNDWLKFVGYYTKPGYVKKSMCYLTDDQNLYAFEITTKDSETQNYSLVSNTKKGVAKIASTAFTKENFYPNALEKAKAAKIVYVIEAKTTVIREALWKALGIKSAAEAQQTNYQLKAVLTSKEDTKKIAGSLTFKDVALKNGKEGDPWIATYTDDKNVPWSFDVNTHPSDSTDQSSPCPLYGGDSIRTVKLQEKLPSYRKSISGPNHTQWTYDSLKNAETYDEKTEIPVFVKKVINANTCECHYDTEKNKDIIITLRGGSLPHS